MNAKELIKAELDSFVAAMQGFGMRIHGAVERSDGVRDNYIITLTAWSDEGLEKQSQYSMNGHAVLGINGQYRTSIIRDRLMRTLQALVF